MFGSTACFRDSLPAGQRQASILLATLSPVRLDYCKGINPVLDCLIMPKKASDAALTRAERSGRGALPRRKPERNVRRDIHSLDRPFRDPQEYGIRRARTSALNNFEGLQAEHGYQARPGARPRLAGRLRSESPIAPPRSYEEIMRIILTNRDHDDFAVSVKEVLTTIMLDYDHPDEGPRAFNLLRLHWVVAANVRGMDVEEIVQVFQSLIPHRDRFRRAHTGFDCKACKEKVVPGSIAVVMPCEHFLHPDCAITDLRSEKACPKTCTDWSPEMLAKFQ